MNSTVYCTFITLLPLKLLLDNFPWVFWSFFLYAIEQNFPFHFFITTCNILLFCQVLRSLILLSRYLNGSHFQKSIYFCYSINHIRKNCCLFYVYLFLNQWTWWLLQVQSYNHFFFLVSSTGFICQQQQKIVLAVAFCIESSKLQPLVVTSISTSIEYFILYSSVIVSYMFQ